MLLQIQSSPNPIFQVLNFLLFIIGCRFTVLLFSELMFMALFVEGQKIFDFGFMVW